MRFEKQYVVNYIGDLVENSAFVYFVSYKGLDVTKFNEFRDELFKQSAECHVMKNRLVTKAAELRNLDDLAALKLAGDTAMVCGTGDAGAVAKVIKEFAKENEQLAAKAGYIDGSVLTAADVDAIASLPSKEVLQAQLLGLLEAPKRNFVSVLNNSVTSIVNVVNAYKNKIEE
ncbi:50S ribosomal protein L10 [Lentisphaerota bacterium WC36G]|nr:50S ribosomal protein L10 [Lentisphaerae bacterium WC36]